MSPRSLGRSAAGVFLLVFLLVPAALAQAQSTLSGTVFGGGSPLANTLVEALNDGTTSVAGSATTNASGQYAIVLADGTYDLRVTPPLGSGFGQETVQNVAISGDRTYDVILLAAGAGKVFGTVRGYGGAPVSGASISLYSSSWQYLSSVSTDANGYYEAVVNGTVHVQINGNDWSATPIAPRSWSASRSSLPVAGNTLLNINLPVSRMSGTVTNQSAAAVANASLEVYGSSYDPALQLSFNFSSYATTDGSGQYQLMVLNSSSNVTVRPANGSGLTPLSANVSIDGDTTRDFTLANAILLTGTVRGLAGAAISGASISTYTSSWQYIASATTDASGHYSVPVASGVVHVQMNGNDWSATPLTPRSWSASRSSLAISGSTTLDVQLPVAQLSGITSDPNGSPVASVSVEAYGSTYDAANQMSFNYSAYATSNAAGNYATVVLDGNASLTARPPSGSGLTPFQASVAVSGNTVYNVTLPAAVILSGVIRGYNGTAVQGASVSVYSSAWQYIGSASTDSSGYYSVSATPGTVHVQANGNDWSATPVTPRSWSASRSSLSVSGPTTLDITLPVVRLDGTTTDSNGAPVPNVSLEMYGSTYDAAALMSFNYSAYATSGPAGAYEMRLLKGQANMTIRPPSSSGFLPASLSPSVTGDFTQRIVLQRPDLSPPQITAGPVVVHHSDTSVSISWTTNEPATSIVDFGIGGLTEAAATPGMVTNHIVTLTGLSPVTGYQFRVSSSDPSGNGPAFGQGSFTTLASPGDITPPQITSGPTVVFVDQTTAIVQWGTDEPASSSIAYGIGGSLDSSVSGPAGVFTLQHSVTLTGLTAQTVYAAQVTSADPDDNSTSSSVFSITTLAEPDTAAPIVTSGPTIVSTTDTQIVVEWTTNEPATSGVSYNNGTQFFVVTDNTLTSTHQVTLSNLSPATAYQITVSSTDAVGNGPTLGGPISGTTDDEADTMPPSINNVQVTQITETSAVITFTTDEPATIVLNYGVDPASLDQTKADLSPSTSHSIMLNGLADGTQHFFTVQATDASNNSAAAGPFDFTTESSFIDQPPTAPGPISGPLSPSNEVSFDLTWGASTDDVLLTGYQVRLDGAIVASYDAFTTTHSVGELGEFQHIFTVLAIDSAGHITESAPFTIMIDRTAPSIATPDHINVGTQGTGATVEYEVLVSDNFDAGLNAACVPSSGFSFPVGDTEIVCTAFDAAGNRGEASFTVTVEDEGAPSLVIPANQTLEATGGGVAVATFTATASDPVDGAIDPVCTSASGSAFPIGHTVVGCTATDNSGNQASGSFTVTVVDTKAPAIASAAPSQSVLWPPNHQLVNLAVAVSVSDLGDAAPVCRISSVSSNEPIDGLGDGDTSPDWMNVSGLTLSLRAERGGKGSGRIYTIVVTCQDASGNASTATTVVAVPKSQGK